MAGSIWDASTGVPCPQCNQETYRLFPLSEDKKGCRSCYYKAEVISEQELEMRETLKGLRRDILAARRKNR
jgi:hypothetical protein